MLGQGGSVTTGHRDVTVVPSTPLAPCAAGGGGADVELGGGAAGVDGAGVDVGRRFSRGGNRTVDCQACRW